MIFASKTPSISSYIHKVYSYSLLSLYKRGQLSQLWLWNYHSDWDRKRAHHVRQPFDSFSPPTYSDFYDVWFVASNTDIFHEDLRLEMKIIFWNWWNCGKCWKRQVEVSNPTVTNYLREPQVSQKQWSKTRLKGDFILKLL